MAIVERSLDAARMHLLLRQAAGRVREGSKPARFATQTDRAGRPLGTGDANRKPRRKREEEIDGVSVNWSAVSREEERSLEK